MTHFFFPGSFDPPHLGHLDLIRRAARIGRLTIGLGRREGRNRYLSEAVVLDLLRQVLAAEGLTEVAVAAYEGATLTEARRLGATALLRGLRSAADLEAERGMAEVHRRAGLDTVFLLTDPALAHCSGSLAREVSRVGLDLESLVHPLVATALRATKPHSNPTP